MTERATNTPQLKFFGAFITSLLVSGVCVAGPDLSLLSGYEADSGDQSYGYAGTLISWRFLVTRLWLDEVRYSFRVGSDKIRARAPGVSGAVGVGLRRKSFFLNILGGWEFRDVRVSPLREGIRVKGSLEGPLVLVDAGLWTGLNRVFFGASYSFATTYLWARLRGLRNLTDGFRVGGEVVAHGNEDYRAFQMGVVGEVDLGPVSLSLKGGYKRDSTGNKAYGGLETYLEF